MENGAFWYIVLRVMLLTHTLAMIRFSSCDRLSRMAVPDVQKLLIRIGNMVQKYKALNTRVESLESKDSTSSENVKEMILEEVAELKEIEGRRLNP